MEPIYPAPCRRLEIPVILLSYAHPLRVYGPERFSQKAKESEVAGILVVDLPFEEAWELKQSSDPAGLDFISPIAPSTSADRLLKIADRAQGFLYCISIVGLTGTARPVLTVLRPEVARVRKTSDLPLVLGFSPWMDLSLFPIASRFLSWVEAYNLAFGPTPGRPPPVGCFRFEKNSRPFY